MKLSRCLQHHYRLAAILFVSIAAVAISIAALSAAIIGTNTPALPLTPGRIAQLPATNQAAWRAYLERSEQQRRADRAFFLGELKRYGLQKSIAPPTARGASSMRLDNRTIWYASAEARGIATNIVSFQTPAGGWSKNLDVRRHPRAPGELFGPENGSQFATAADFDAEPDGVWNYVGTIDNDATTTELRFLAKVISAGEPSQNFQQSFQRGIEYLLAAQYPNGGWPQVWPLQGGYHDAITFNDGAMLDVIELLRDTSEARAEFSFVPDELRAKAADAVKRGIACVLATQIVCDGRPTVWCQQHDMLTLQPTSARNYEMPSQCSGESAGVMMFLMKLPDPSQEVVRSVDAAADWFEKTKLMNIAFKSVGAEGRQLVSAPGNGPLWARYYKLCDDKPIFGDRDKSVHDDVNEISKERRGGYSWYTDAGKRALQHYNRWHKEQDRAARK